MSTTMGITMTTTTRTLPVVDIGPYLDPGSSTSQRQQTASILDKACRDFGFFYLIGHGVPEGIRAEMLRLGREFFALPAAEKKEISISKSIDKVRGYERLGENVTLGKRDVLEGLDIYRELPGENDARLRGRQLWPKQPTCLKEVTLNYVDQLTKVGKALMCAMADALGKDGSEEAFDKLTQDPFWGLKFIRYPPLSTDEIAENEKGISCGEHTDYGGLTFLLADEHVKSALQVQDHEGGWIKADPMPGAYVVNIGDIINVLTNNEYTATVHRVIHNGNQDRISIPFFFEPSLCSVVEPLKSCVTDRGIQVPVSKVSYYEHMCNMLYGGRFVEPGAVVDKVIVNEISLKG
ncbi:hypothetical protein LTR10_022041 [Elasticomyces elasticus]|uniref:Fe2OG dioxygenase domain-containing protein n=1 Tax=Exophiala sideris TaxID=1016849 RepID=A0ABR0JM56_9EURO|nr:hypothetical protein LTR10_022041 [Elasticomyces elasticus]KAK5036476.1 hypothetical protein LTS07_002203 [Exophiala sideris]KAK5041695.1 hypothetical protein LTR13_002362 [Exophiala sideris]KAK5066859.1 hypothetical protein LTR69_002207 [Exophiala sideris]KAK5184918.1 hypothetical protein LTR44_002764 [Eurotiomycetes sp. CCFEE 6388]